MGCKNTLVFYVGNGFQRLLDHLLASLIFCLQLTGILGPPIIKYAFPDSKNAGNTLSDLEWQIPLCALSAVVLLRLLLAPYWIWKKENDKVIDLERRLSFEEFNGKIFLECKTSMLPDIVPPSGNITTVQLFPGMGTGQRHGVPGTKLEWFRKENHCYRCIVKNYATEPIFNIEIKFYSYFFEMVNINEQASQTGEVKHNQEQIINIPVLGANASDEYEFFIYNGSEFHVQISLPETATLKRIGTNELDTVIINSSHGFYKNFPLMFPVNVLDLKKEADL